jgi:copper homeostasis protein
MILEVCIDSVESALAAQEGGAARVELCADLTHGGTTPSAEIVRSVREHVSIPISVMVRPRPGGFCYSELEFDEMKRDVEMMKQLGANGVVIGLLTENGAVEVDRTRVLLEIARPMFVTFHRAFDECKNLDEALVQLKKLGVERILTSGGKKEISEGLPEIARLVKSSAGSIKVMAGGGVRFENVKEVVKRTNVDEIHVLTAVSDDLFQPQGSSYRDHISTRRVDSFKVRKMVLLLTEPTENSAA